MARSCAFCGKSTQTGNIVTFSHRKIKRTWKPNLHKVRAIIDGSPKRVYACTKCLKAGKVEKAGY